MKSSQRAVKHASRAARAVLQGASIAAAAGLPPLAVIAAHGVEADTGHAYIVAAVQSATLYAFPWSTSDYSSDPNSLCSGDYSWGGWWHCDAGIDFNGQPRTGLDWHSGGGDVGGMPVWFKAYSPTPYNGAHGDVVNYTGCSSGRKIILSTVDNQSFFEAGFVHLQNDPDTRAAVGSSLFLDQGWTSFRVGDVHSGGDCGLPVHLHQDGSPSARNRAPEDACNQSQPAYTDCYYANAWTGAPPSNYLFDATWQYSTGGSGGK